MTRDQVSAHPIIYVDFHQPFPLLSSHYHVQPVRWHLSSPYSLFRFHPCIPVVHWFKQLWPNFYANSPSLCMLSPMVSASLDSSLIPHGWPIHPWLLPHGVHLWGINRENEHQQDRREHAWGMLPSGSGTPSGRWYFCLDHSAQKMHPEPCPSMEKGVEEVDEGFSPLFYLGSQVGYAHQDNSHTLRGGVRVLPEFPLLVPFIVLLPLSVSALAY